MKTSKEEAMTLHHDVAGVVAELRTVADRIDASWAFAPLRQAADLLESQAKALSEAETLAFRLNSGEELQTLMRLNNEVLDRALAAEARLAEAMKVIELIADGSIDIGGTAIIIGSDARAIIQAARNAAKEKTDAS